MDYGREMLHAYPYREVPRCWREMYSDAGILKAFALCCLHETPITGNDGADILYRESLAPLRMAITACDNVLIMAGACGHGRKPLLYDLIEAIEVKIEEREQALPSPHKRQKKARLSSVKLEEDFDPESSPVIKCPIPRVHLPAFDVFRDHVHNPSGATPLIITGAIDHWRARSRWTHLDSICQAGPDRLVPIEIGNQYTDEQWTQKLVTVREFIEQYIITPNGFSSDTNHDDDSERRQLRNQKSQRQIGYLAQHDLFDQIPRLRRDVDIPDYCLIDVNEQQGYHPPDDVLLNAWFGPKETVSPMHTDPYHNLLAQVVGRKYVRLYSPEETSKLYPYGTFESTGKEIQRQTVNEGEEKTHDDDGQEQQERSMLNNTSQVNVENPDLEKHPRFTEAKYVDAILEPGDLLYIPFQWWHYIRSLSISFSVSFWF
ncbi:hypothetical protein BCR41DRAFT_361729 [Lobosporangium transversale]|uniref:JmjC domain-containing protein n=1 Tax=Lobosporangium transversale TaxID=64571 RepID=A0A1Y2GAE6_9FUNG|nr:hypothetical protein BCR41DRAFT_361729 [Lobosporangium transversale]ORZ05522.1 hypothetical protein BCR41DRAFT_361729 [Lobosporangium transversale]|eukprot:XP_021877096.1 hypothetical protein BCR41DRAFT_361729 [Lobosporangium transversale]